MKTRSADRKSVKNSTPKIDLPQSYNSNKTQIEKVYAERGKSNNSQLPVFNIHVHISNSNKNNSSLPPVQPIIHLHINENELANLSPKKCKSSPTKKRTKSASSTCRKNNVSKSPKKNENKNNVCNSDFKNSLITDYLTCVTPVSSKSEKKNFKSGKSLKPISEISDRNENLESVETTETVANNSLKENQNFKEQSKTSKMVNMENDSNANKEVNQFLLSNFNATKEVSVVLTDINCERNIHNSENCPKKINNKIITASNINLLGEINSVEKEDISNLKKICQSNDEKSAANDEQNCSKEKAVTTPKNKERNENSFYNCVYSSSDESCETSDSVINTGEDNIVKSLPSSAKNVTPSKSQIENPPNILKNINGNSKSNFKSNLQEKFVEVEAENERTSNGILFETENSTTEAESLANECAISDEDNVNVSIFDSDEEISTKNWSTESVNGYNFSEILQKLRNTKENDKGKTKNISPPKKNSIEKALEFLFSDKGMICEEKNESENKNDLNQVSSNEASSIIVANATTINNIQESVEESRAPLSLNTINEILQTDIVTTEESIKSKENVSDSKNICDSAVESFLSDFEETNISKRIEEDNALPFVAVNAEQTLKLHSHCDNSNILDNSFEKEIEEKRKKEDEISATKKSKQKHLINSFRQMDDYKVTAYDDDEQQTKNSADTDSHGTEILETKKKKKIKKKKDKHSSTESVNSPNISVNSFCKEPETNLTEDKILKNNLDHETKNEKNVNGDNLENKDKNLSEICRFSNNSKAIEEETEQKESTDEASDNFSLGKEGREKEKPTEAKSDEECKSNEVENNNLDANKKVSEDESEKPYENNLQLKILNPQKNVLMSWSSEDSLFREKVKHKKIKKKSKKSSKHTDENQTGKNVDCSKYENVKGMSFDSDEEPALVIDDVSESEISFFFDEIDSEKMKKKKNQVEDEQHEFCNFSPKSTASTHSKDMFFSQDCNRIAKKNETNDSTVKKNKTENCHQSPQYSMDDDMQVQRQENVKKFLDFDSPPKKRNFFFEEKKEHLIKETNVDEEEVGNENDEMRLSKNSSAESVGSKSKKSSEFSTVKEREKETKNKLEKIKKWIQDNSSPPSVKCGIDESKNDENVHTVSEVHSEPTNCQVSEKRKKRKKIEDYFEGEKPLKKKKKKSKESCDRDEETTTEKSNNFNGCSDETEKDILLETSDAEVDSNHFENKFECQTEKSDKYSTSQSKEMSLESEKSEKSCGPKIFVEVIRNLSNNIDYNKKIKKKKKSVELISETSSIDLQLDLIEKEMNRRRLTENKKKKLKKKIKKQVVKQPAKDSNALFKDAITKKKRRKKKKDYDDCQDTGEAKKTKTFKEEEEEEAYIPLEAEGPTKFSVAVLNKIEPYNGHDASTYKEKMLFGNRVKRFSKSNTHSIKKAKQKANLAFNN